VREVLSALTPGGITAAAAALESTQAEQVAIQKAQARLLQHAEDEVADARRRYQQVDSGNRRVKADLENELEGALRRLDERKQALANPSQIEPLRVTPTDLNKLVALAEDLPTLWNAPTTTHEDRKRIIQSVLSQVIVDVTNEAIEVELVWTGGYRQPLRILRSKGVDQVVLKRWNSGMTAPLITHQLQSAGFISKYGRPLSLGAVHQRLRKHGARLRTDRQQAWWVIQTLLRDGWTGRDVLKILPTAFPRLGKWTYGRLMRTVYTLQRGVAGLSLLPKALPTDHVKHRIVRFIRRRRRAGLAWRAIADELNVAGLRPQKASRFSWSQVFSLAHRNRCGTAPERETVRPSLPDKEERR
jgi:hypothetical protein